MARAALSLGAYKRTGNPELAALNCYAEQYPGATGADIQMRVRPGMAAFVTVGGGPFRGCHQRDGINDGQACLLSGTAAYLVSETGATTLQSGTVAGDDLVDMDSGQDNDLNSVVRIATGSKLYKIVGGLVTDEVFPDVGGAGASSICYHRGYWIATEAGTDKFYYQIPGDTTWGALSFASAEYAPDALVAVRSRGDQIVMLGGSTTEVFTLSGDAANPIVPYGGLNFDHGCRARATAVNCKGSLVYVDSECNVRRFDGGTPQIVSDPGLVEQIRAVDASDLRAWTFAADGHRFYVLTLGSTATWVYDLTANAGGERWFTFNSLGYDYWRGHLGFSIGDQVYALDNGSVQVYRLDATLRTDGGTQFPMEWTALIEGAETSFPLSNVVAVLDVGDAPRTGQGSAPIISLKVSGNQGKTFGAWRERPLNVTGDYDSVPRWNGLGDVAAFYGAVLRFRIADPVGRIVKRIHINVP